MNNLKPIQIERGVHVRAPSCSHAPSCRAHHSEFPPSIPNRNDKLIVVQRKEIPVTDPDWQRKGEVECEFGRRVDSDVVELELGEFESWIGRENSEEGISES
ncbi:hypothetical protein V6N13_139397 [Hibiscus sabdariffa]|uniref:Uncharacterized protein n=1 Tax=Hibiscus sabdariffa TaxID=183260 RepID=A0ABR2C895_9ROSI